MKHTRSLALALTLLVPACGDKGAQPAATPVAPPTASAAAPLPPPPYGTKENLATLVDSYAAGFGAAWGPGYAPSGYVLVARGGEPVLSRAFGIANPKTGAPANEATRFRIGSLTKQFTAVAILKLASEKKLSLEDPVRRWVPALPAAFDAVTLRHLLAQTSGIPSYTQDEALMKERAKPTEPGRVLQTFMNKPLAFSPGAQFEYSNSNYFLLGLVVERASGQSYHRYLSEKVTGPAGMVHTSTVDAPDAPNTAVGRTLDESDELTDAAPIDMSVPFAAGALRSTPHDLLLWDRALSSHALLDAPMEELRTTPVKDNYAFGVLRERRAGHDVEWHNGGIDGFSSYMARVPDLGLCVVVLMNTDAFPTDKLANGVLRIALEGKPEKAPEERKVLPYDAPLADALYGDYRITDESKAALEKVLPKTVLDSVLTTAFTTDGRRLRMKPAGQGSILLYFGENGALFTKKSGIVVRPTRDAAGKITGVSLEQGRLTIAYLRQR